MIDTAFEFLNRNPLFSGVIMMMMQFGTRFIAIDLPKSSEKIFSHPWFRRLTVFAIAFMATHNIKYSIFLTLIFVIVFKFLVNENSRVCLLPQHMKETDDKVTKEDAEKAVKTLEAYRKQSGQS